MKDLEYAKCVLADSGLEVDTLNSSCVRGSKNTKYFFDVWVSHKKKKFIGYTVLVWNTKKYFRKVLDLEKFVLEHLKI